MKNIKRAYFIGIKGVGMTMLAQFLDNEKIKLSGSDVSEKFLTDQTLKNKKIKVFSPYSKDNIDKQADLIVYTSALIGQENPELEFIRKNKKIFSKAKILNYAQALSLVFNQHQGIAVCGSHGKTTTSAWLGFVLKELKKSPKVLVGSYVKQFKGSAYLGKNKTMIAEVDEYQNKLKYFNPHGVVLNNIDFDHPDYFKSKADYYKVFQDFVKKIKPAGFLVANLDDKLVKKTLRHSKAKIYSYSFNEKSQADLIVTDYYTKNNYTYFNLKDYGQFKISLLGKHNIENALAVLATCLALKIDIKQAKSPLAKFKGTARRLEYLGKYKEVKVYDDYGHHPTELKATFKAIKEKYPDNRLVVLFHPHTFSRTKALLYDFSQSFSLVDVLGVLKIFASAREKEANISSQDLVKEIRKVNKETFISYLDNFEIAQMWIKKTLQKGDVLLLVGAGNVNKVGESLLNKEN